MALPLHPGTASALFADHFGRLVVLLRLEPSNVPAQKEALRQAVAVLRTGPVHLETGVEGSDLPNESTFKGRLLSRRVEAIRLQPWAAAGDVLTLARALADDQAPIAGSQEIAIELLPASPPPVFTAETLSERSRTISGPVDEARRLATSFEHSIAHSYWTEAINAAQALVAMIGRYPEHERRDYQLSLRRLFTRSAMEELILYALRASEEQHRVVDVLRNGGRESLELAIEHVMRAEAIGPRRFLYDLIAERAEALWLLIPLLDSPTIHVICHAVDLLGRLGLPEAIEPLRRISGHPDPRVRRAVVQALGRFHGPTVIEPIRRGLADNSPAIRSAAAHLLADRNSGGLVMPILAVLETEKDPATWREMVLAMGRIESAEAANALVGLALNRKVLLKSGGYPVLQRLTVVESLVSAGHANAMKALERLAREADGAIRSAAEKAAGR